MVISNSDTATTQNTRQETRHSIIEPSGSKTIPKIYINSVAVTEKNTWLVSFTRADQPLVNDPFVPERVFIRRSENRGLTWHNRIMVYDGSDKGAKQAEMGQLVVVPNTNRIYQFSVCHTGVRFGRIVFTYSDDDGHTWIGPEGTNSAFDIDVGNYVISPNGDSNHLMAKGIIMDNGEFILPMAVASDPLELDDIEAEVVFLICDNLFSEKDPRKLNFIFYPLPPHGIRVPKSKNSDLSLAQEPHVVQLSDDRLMCTMRTGLGYICYSVSSDFGRSWTAAKPLCYTEGQKKILHPNAPCPLVRLRNGRFLLLHHNNCGDAYGATGPYDFRKNRRPVYTVIGREFPNYNGQPIWFAGSQFLRDSDGVPASSIETTELSCYAGIIEDERGVFYIYGNKWSQIEVMKIPPMLLNSYSLY